RKPEEQQLKKAIRKVMGIFKSSLFQALLVVREKIWLYIMNTTLLL
uniref:L27-1 domain-containing protein n=1 Tax=Anas platyrhynchos TaxID=8839 RepID=A0A8B9R1K7_ANAPL